MKLVKGDTVQVISGNEKGKTGRIIKIFPFKNKVVVEGLNMVKKHSRPTQENPQGGILEKEAAIHISNLMLMDNCIRPLLFNNMNLRFPVPKILDISILHTALYVEIGGTRLNPHLAF